MLAKREKREVYRWHFVNLYRWHFVNLYRWHFVNRLANHFSHLSFRHSRQAIGIFTKHQRGRYGQFLIQVSRRMKDERNRRCCEKCIVIGSQSHEIVHKILHEHVEMRETISV